MFANCPDCNRATKATTWEDSYGEIDGAVFCDWCGWNDRNSKALHGIRQRRTAAALGLTVEQFQARLRDEARERWLAADPELAPF